MTGDEIDEAVKVFEGIQDAIMSVFEDAPLDETEESLMGRALEKVGLPKEWGGLLAKAARGDGVAEFEFTLRCAKLLEEKGIGAGEP